MTDNFTERYRTGQTPWDIGRPQPAFVERAEEFHGAVLDVGCGTGDLSLFASGLPAVTSVHGLDPSEFAIDVAKKRAKTASSRAKFSIGSALELHALQRSFDTILDCLVFHIFDDDQRIQYVDGLRDRLASGGLVYVLVFSDAEPEGTGPRRVSEKELRSSFASGFEIASLDAVRLSMNDDGTLFTPGGPHGWFARIRRTIAN